MVPLHDFYLLPRREHQTSEGYHPVTVLAADEIVVAITIPPAPEGTRSAYVKISERGAWDFAMVSAAVRLTVQEDTVRSARVVLGGVAAIPWRAAEAEAALTGRPTSEEAIREAAEASVEGAHPLEHNTYKVPLTVQALAQALRSLA
jgi:xanthine dehydrogenase YagS FAD-binding subunit